MLSRTNSHLYQDTSTPISTHKIFGADSSLHVKGHTTEKV